MRNFRGPSASARRSARLVLLLALLAGLVCPPALVLAAADPSSVDPNASLPGEIPPALQAVFDAMRAQIQDLRQQVSDLTSRLDRSTQSLQSAADTVRPSVVGVVVRRILLDQQGFPTYTTVSGSGLVAAADGLIWTNYHVIEGGATIKVMLHDRRVFDATVVHSDQLYDLALLKIAAKDLIVPALRTVTDRAVGETAAVMGSPNGLQHFNNVTGGVVSAVGVATDGFMPYIQIDAPISPGNSGGPAFDLSGRVIGLVTWKLVGLSVEGAGFLIPSAVLRETEAQFSARGYVPRAYLGVAVEEPWEAAVGLPAADVGLTVVHVVTGSAAEKAGIQAGDTILQVDGVDVASMYALTLALKKHRPGETAAITVRSPASSTSKTIWVTLAHRPSDLGGATIREDEGYGAGLWFELGEEQAAGAGNYGRLAYRNRDNFDLKAPWTFSNGYATATVITPYLAVAMDTYAGEERNQPLSAADIEVDGRRWSGYILIKIDIFEDSSAAVNGTSLVLEQGDVSKAPALMKGLSVGPSPFAPGPPKVHWHQELIFTTDGLDPDADFVLRARLPGGREMTVPVAVGRIR